MDYDGFCDNYRRRAGEMIHTIGIITIITQTLKMAEITTLLTKTWNSSGSFAEDQLLLVGMLGVGLVLTTIGGVRHHRKKRKR